MMTEREALNFADRLANSWTIYVKGMEDFCDTVIKNLGLQIPTEPIVDEKTDNWTCPNCFDEYSDTERHKFCPNCGQAIKHKEEK